MGVQVKLMQLHEPLGEVCERMFSLNLSLWLNQPVVDMTETLLVAI